MSNFIFKVPEPPEDARRKRRKMDHVLKPDHSQENWNDNVIGLTDSSQMFLRNNNMREHNDLLPEKDFNFRDSVEASTSYHNKPLFKNNEKFNSFQSLFTRFEKSKIDDKMKQKCFLNRSENRFNSDFSSSSQNISDIASEKRVYNNGVNVHRINSLMKPSWNNSLNINPEIKTRNPVFNTFFLPQKNGFRDLSMNAYERTINSGINQYSSLNRTNLNKTSSLLFNTCHNKIDNEIMMKSILQTSVVSLKEQVMNALENFGHLVLSNTHDKESSTFQYAFHKIVKEMKQIFENNVMFTDSIKDKTTMSYKSETLCAPQQIIMGNERRIYDHCEMPNNTLHNLIFNQNKSVNYHVKPHFIETFTIEKKKRRYNSDNINEKMEVNPHKIAKGNSEELNLKNWYPLVLRDGLAFVGINDKNIHVETLTMKKRLSNRKIQLIDGLICNLIGSPSKDIKFPLEISSKIKNGLHPHWKLLMDAISKFQKKTFDKENVEIKDNEVLTHQDTSSMKTSTISSNKGKSKKRRLSLINKTPNATAITTTKEIQKDIHYNSDILKVTRSGRISKRPGNLWIGADIHKTNEKNISFHSNEEITDFTSKTSSRKIIKENKSKTAEYKDKVKSLTRKSSRLQKNKKNEKKFKFQSNKNQTADLQKNNAVSGSTNKNPKKFLRSSLLCAKSAEQEFEEQLNDIMIPEISSRSEETKFGNKKIKMMTLETPPLKFFRNNLRILGSCTPVQSPNWQISQHTQSEVKKFEQIRSRAFKKKNKTEKKIKNSVKVKHLTRNKDVETVMKWISEKEVKSPKKGSKVIEYMMAKKCGLESDESDEA